MKNKKCLKGCSFVRDGVPDCVADGVCPLSVLSHKKEVLPVLTWVAEWKNICDKNATCTDVVRKFWIYTKKCQKESDARWKQRRKI